MWLTPYQQTPGNYLRFDILYDKIRQIMRRFFLKHPQLINRIVEIIIPLTTWAIITMPLWLSPFHPAVVAYFLLSFNVYFFYKSLTVTIYSTISYLKLKKLLKVDWQKKARKLPGYSKIHHAIILTNYKENYEKVYRSLKYLSRSQFPKKRILIFLAMEKREGKDAKTRAEKLISEFKNQFGLITASYHPNITNEIIGKASNATWAAKTISRVVRKRGLDIDFITITSCDADALIPDKYFSYLTCEFLTDNDRFYHFYWAPVLLYSNFWEVALPVRIQATLSSIVRLSSLAKPE